MPELPEVETTRRGLEPLIAGRSIEAFEIREPRLRWPVPGDLDDKLGGRRITRLGRRAKYLLIATDGGTLILHLGMSGSLRYLPDPRSPTQHDHVDMRLAGGGVVRFNDPRRFGSLHFAAEPLDHPLLRSLGPEPLGDRFDGEYLARSCAGRRVAIKQHLMNSRVVAGVGNIYASEALFRAGIHPARQAGRIARRRLDGLAEAVRAVLNDAIGEGGTTLRDFVASDGRPGYFRMSLAVYDREDAPCKRCGLPVRMRRLGQRASYYCAGCQR